MDGRRAKRKKGDEPTTGDFYLIAKEVQNRSGKSPGSFTTEDRQFRDFFGIPAEVALAAWNLMVETGLLPAEGQILHFLWALHFMKEYPKQSTGSATAGGSGGAKDPKTWRKYLWPFVYALSGLEYHVVSFNMFSLLLYFQPSLLTPRFIFTAKIDFGNRKFHHTGNDCLLSVDCTDFRIPNRYGRAFASFKYKGKSALRYEIALDIEKGDISWINGGYPAGKWTDIEIFREGLMLWLDTHERVEADDGYIGEARMYVKCPASFPNPPEKEEMQSRVRARQETINKRFKQWEILKQVYRHDIMPQGMFSEQL